MKQDKRDDEGEGSEGEEENMWLQRSLKRKNI